MRPPTWPSGPAGTGWTHGTPGDGLFRDGLIGWNVGLRTVIIVRIIEIDTLE
jgi:hypothetical protein